MADTVQMPKKNDWIYWRWKKDGSKTWSYDRVQDIDGDMLELTGNSFGSKYPTRVLITEIEFKKASKK